MKRHHMYYPLIFLFSMMMGSLTISSPALSQTMEIEKQAHEYYQPQSWPRSSNTPVLGLKLDNFRFDGFEQKETRYFAPARGTNYILYHEKEQMELWTIVSVYDTSGASQDGLFKWLTTGTNALLKKGTLTSSTAQIGDISWADPASCTLAFARDNVVIIMMDRTPLPAHHQLMERIASTIDEGIKAAARAEKGPEDIKAIKPVIESVTLGKSELHVNGRTKIKVIGRDPRGGRLHYYYSATGGNILHTKEGIIYHATTPGAHKITVTAINPANMATEEIISVTVTE